MSTGMYGVVRDALSWVAVAGVMALVILNFEQVRAFNRQLLGLEHTERQTPTAALARADEDNTSATASSSGAVRLVADRQGHYAADADINGNPISLMVDTGASLVVLTYDDAQRAGVFVGPSDFTAQSRTANGVARNAVVNLNEVCVKDVCVDDVQAMVAEPGRLHVSLLGMTYLSRLKRVDMQSGRLTLEN